MLLRSDYFDGRFEKIAQSIRGIAYRDNTRSLNLQNTLAKSRDNADLQPLHKDTETDFRPKDSPFATKMKSKQNHLSNIEDKRITHNHLRRRSSINKVTAPPTL